MKYKYTVEKFCGKVYCGNAFCNTLKECREFGDDGFCTRYEIHFAKTGELKEIHIICRH